MSGKVEIQNFLSYFIAGALTTTAGALQAGMCGIQQYRLRGQERKNVLAVLGVPGCPELSRVSRLLVGAPNLRETLF